jgi:competence protein ComEC
VLGAFSLRYTAPGGIAEPTFHSGNRIFLLAYPKGDCTVIPAETTNMKYLPAMVRQKVSQLMEQLLPEDVAPFLKALLLGDTSGMDYGVQTDLSVSGIRHVVAVSGLHVSILMTLVYLFFGRNRFVTLVVGVPLLLFFAAIAGFSPSVIRACVMQALMLLSLVLNREYDPPTALSFAVLGMLVANPVVITNVGFQLSVSSVAGIFLFSTPISQWLLDGKRFGRFRGKKGLFRFLTGFCISVSVSVGAMLLTVPLTAWYFGMVNLLSVVTNLLCLWMVTFVFCGAILVCAVGAVWLPAGIFLGWLLAWPVRYILWISRAIASIPLAAVYTQSIYVVLWLILCYALLTVFLCFPDRKPGVLLSCAVLGLCLALLASWTEPMLDDYRMTVLDVGQGQCILLQSGGKNYLVDCGGDREEDAADKAATTLLSQGVTRLDGLILTHYDLDHAGGAGLFLQRVPTDVLVLPQWDPMGIGTKLAENADCDVLWVSGKTEIEWPEGQITVFAGQISKTGNESGSCVLFQTEKCDILITGDQTTGGELALLATYEIPELDALVIGHHGADDATSYTLLAKTKPKIAVISVGGKNRYGMPAQPVLDRLEQYGCKIRRTDREGTIRIRG